MLCTKKKIATFLYKLLHLFSPDYLYVKYKDHSKNILSRCIDGLNRLAVIVDQGQHLHRTPVMISYIGKFSISLWE